MTNRWTGPAVLAAYAVFWIAVARTADGQSVYCPPDRPYRRVVEQPISTCTLLGCQKMVCEKDSDRCQLVITADCNTCSRAPDVMVCLSQEELDKAR